MKRKISAKVYKKKACNSQNCFDYPQVKKTHSVLKQGDFWLVIENKYPYLEYEGLKVIDHFLIIPKRNIINWAKVKKQELEELYTLSNSCLIGKTHPSQHLYFFQ